MQLCYSQARKYPKNPKKLTKKLKTHGIKIKKTTFSSKMIIPSDLNDFQPRDTQVWNCDEIWFESNEIWNKVIFTYKLFQGEQMWKVQTKEQAPLW